MLANGLKGAASVTVPLSNFDLRDIVTGTATKTEEHAFGHISFFRRH